jgi:subtilisin family serine protease
MHQDRVRQVCKWVGAVVLATAAAWLATAQGQELQQPASGPEFVAGELIVKFRSSTDTSRRNLILASRSARLLRRFETVDMERVQLPAGQSVAEAIALFRAIPDVELVQPNYIRRIVAPSPPNDPFWLTDQLWGLLKIQARQVWTTYTTGNSNLVVADIDTGVQYTHADLAANMWSNPGEIAGNGVDDDANGHIDDVFGIDTVNGDSNPMDDHGHGTHTSGTIAGVGNNGVGVVGVSWNTKILACKFLDSSGSGPDSAAIDCFNYIVMMKQRGINIRVSNNSWGGDRIPPNDPPAAALKAAIDTAGANGILNVFAAGNAGNNIENFPFDPASFTSPSIISVAASDPSDNRAGFSNYGAVSVDLAAPGTSIISTYPFGSGYASSSGTSMAAPHVAGAAALLLAIDPSLTVASLKVLLTANVDPLPQWAGIVASGGRLNVFLAASALNAPPSVSLTSPASGATFTAPATVSFAATANDTDGTVTRVEFYANGVLVGSDTTNPFTFDWPNVAAATYSLTAKAFDDDLASTTSGAVSITVNPPAGQTNVALAANGGVATASSTHSSGFAAAGAINGDRRGQVWGAGGGWNDATPNAFPDWLEVNFNGPKSINEVSVFSVQDNYTAPVEPTPSQIFALYGLRDFEVQYSTGGAWVTVPGGAVTNNTLVWRRIMFPALTATKVRVLITNALDTWSRVTELEVLGSPISTAPPTVALTSPASGSTYTAPATVSFAATASDSDGTIARVDFLANGAVVGTDTTPDISGTYSFDWTAVGVGTYNLTATAVDNLGATTTSSPRTITVTGGGGGRVNYALPAQGGVALASSVHSSGYAPAGAVNGDRRGAPWGGGAGWNDATMNTFPDWLEVQFGAGRTIDEINVFSVQDAYTSPSEPTPAMTFTLYGLQSFDVQYWTGSTWATVPGGAISGNTLVWRQVTFAPITTTAIRVFVSQALGSWSRIAELEAIGPGGAPPPGGVNVALASMGATALASSFHSGGYAPAGAINGDRRGASWGAGGGWNDGTSNIFPDSLEIQFAGIQTIDEIDVFSVQDAFTAPSEPTPAMTFTLYGLRSFQVEYWTGSAWALVPGASVTGNSLVWRQFTFAPITTSRIRVFITQTADQWSRITEVEAWTPDAGGLVEAPAVFTMSASDGNDDAMASVRLTRAGTDAGAPDVLSVALLSRRDEGQAGRRRDDGRDVRHPASARRGAEPRRALRETGS